MAEVVLRDVRKSFDTVEIIHGVSLTIHDGEFVVFVGPSGCGKSTLLRLIAGLETITAGEVTIAGKRCNDLPPAEREIAMVFQSYALYPHMSVYDNMAFSLKLAHMAKAEVRERVQRAADILQIGPLLSRKPKALSGGQRQRVAMGRAIVRKPSAFLMDEPLSNLDAKLRVQMRAEIARIQREFKTTTIYVTHDQVEAMTMGDRVAVLNGGRIEQCDRPRDLYDRPANLFVAAFIGSPSMNFFAATLESCDAGVAARAGGVMIPLDTASLVADIGAWIGRRITVGVRAESITAAPVREGSPRLQGVVEFVEELGSEVIVHTGVAGLATSPEIESALAAASDDRSGAPVPAGNLVTRLPAHTVVRPGERIDLFVDPANVHCFDPAGPSLRAGAR